MVVKVSGVETSKNIRLQQRVTTKSVKKKLSKLIEITPRPRREIWTEKYEKSRPRCESRLTLITMEIGMKEEMGVADKMTLLVLRSGRIAVNCAKSSLKRIY